MGLSCTQRQSFRSQFGSRVSGELRERFSIRGPVLPVGGAVCDRAGVRLQLVQRSR